MNFPFLFGVILGYLTVTCNGQFKILGVLDTKSENSNGKVKNIRFSDDQFSQQKFDELSAHAVVNETAYLPENIDGKKENLNFIKPLESSTNEMQQFFVESTSVVPVKNETTNDEVNQSETISDKDVTSKRISVSDVSKIVETNTASLKIVRPSSTTFGARAYRKMFQPNIRKFSYIEARSFHHPDPSNHIASSSRLNNYKFIKVLKYRNKYKSKCRCERIWNCPKIQISIQRCQPDYFMCCF